MGMPSRAHTEHFPWTSLTVGHSQTQGGPFVFETTRGWGQGTGGGGEGVVGWPMII